MTAARNVLAVVSPHVGGRGIGAGLATLFPEGAGVTVVEAPDEDRRPWPPRT
jgi:hypothetical protein